MSDAAHPDAFSMLAPGLQRALWDMKWRDLRQVQKDAILAWNAGPADLLIMAQTAGGKTEAAFLPVLSAIAAEPDGSVRAVYVGPLKALINDQFERVELLCRHMDMPVHRWHGDVGDGSKDRLVESPGGVLLITPESLESLLINRTARLPAMFGGLRAVVIDETHAFLENERGRQLSSLLARIGRYVAGGARPRRVGLSATIGEPAVAAAFLCAEKPESVVMIEGKGEQKELLARVHWYGGSDGATERRSDEGGKWQSGEVAEWQSGEEDRGVSAIAADLVTHMHGSTNLVFANAKGRIEMLADAANRVCRERGLEERFHVHHGSLSRVMREDVEREMKEPMPDTAVCSSTLEMGIDIGGVRTVGQVGPPWSVASLKQRLGRSGRRDGESRRLRVYLEDESEAASENPEKRLPLDLVQTVAVLELMLTDRWVEPAAPARLDVSTLAQQVIGVVAETGGVRADELYRRLCGAGVFGGVTPRLFAGVLRSLGSRDVLEQTGTGELILGLKGEEIRSSREFYAVFQTPREFSVRAGDAVIGALPMAVMPREGDHLVLGGRRWMVRSVDADRLEIAVVPARGAKAPLFSGSAGEVHPRIRERMLEVLRGGVVEGGMAYLDAGARAALEFAATTAREQGLASRRVVEMGAGSCAVMCWSGTRVQETVAAVLRRAGIAAKAREVSVVCQAGAGEVESAAAAWLGAEDRDVLGLAARVEPRIVRKYDELMDGWVLDESIAADRLDVEGAAGVIGQVVDRAG